MTEVASCPCPRCTEPPRRYSFTRPELVEAISRLEAYPATVGPGQRVFVAAESMADAIIEALEGEPEPVHYRWPVACGGFSGGGLWSGNLDRVTCEACKSAATEGAA